MQTRINIYHNQGLTTAKRFSFTSFYFFNEHVEHETIKWILSQQIHTTSPLLLISYNLDDAISNSWKQALARHSGDGILPNPATRRMHGKHDLTILSWPQHLSSRDLWSSRTRSTLCLSLGPDTCTVHRRQHCDTHSTVVHQCSGSLSTIRKMCTCHSAI